MDDHASATKIPSRNVRGRPSALLACAMFGGSLLAAGCSGGVAVAQIEMRVNGGGSRARMQSAQEACKSLPGGAHMMFGPGPG
jgi:hypothetical protein